MAWYDTYFRLYRKRSARPPHSSYCEPAVNPFAMRAHSKDLIHMSWTIADARQPTVKAVLKVLLKALAPSTSVP